MRETSNCVFDVMTRVIHADFDLVTPFRRGQVPTDGQKFSMTTEFRIILNIFEENQLFGI